MTMPLAKRLHAQAKSTSKSGTYRELGPIKFRRPVEAFQFLPREAFAQLG